jgi:hypothetical protein
VFHVPAGRFMAVGRNFTTGFFALPIIRLAPDCNSRTDPAIGSTRYRGSHHAWLHIPEASTRISARLLWDGSVLRADHNGQHPDPGDLA